MKVFRNPDILWREEEDSTTQAYDGLTKGDDVSEIGTSVLFSDGVMLSLNVLGTEIWKRCDGRSEDEIISELATLFDVDLDTLKKDARQFLSQLVAKGFIRYAE
jgi:pyrroloquinoline quinone biosynthesis protein D